LIKITKYIHVHFLTVFLAVVCFFTNQIRLLGMCYAIMAVHEGAHLLAAVLIGLRPEKIVIYPFGLNLRLKNKMVYSLSDEIILYASGPLMNIVMALGSIFFMNSWAWAYSFYIQNIVLFVLNLLPVVPLDGGVIMKKIFGRIIGFRAAEKLMKCVSLIMVSIMGVLGLYLALINHFNYSICFLVIFILCNFFTAEEKYNIDFVRELMFYKEKGRDFKNRCVKVLIMKKGEDLKKIAAEFSTEAYYIVFCLDDEGKVSEIMSESEIMERIA